jgi:hypothetical protein
VRKTKRFIELFQRHKESGLTIKEFCISEIIDPATFCDLKKKLRSRNRLSGFMPIVINSTPISLRSAA